MARSFTTKQIEITIRVGSTVYTFNEHSCEVSITKPGLIEKNSAQISIWGLDLPTMKQLTTLAYRPLEYRRNFVVIKAGTEGERLSVAFSGEITSAFGDFSSAPDVLMQMTAETGFYPQLIPQAPIDIAIPTPAQDVFGLLASSMGYTFRNEGLLTVIKPTRLNGSPMEKAIQLAEDINCELIVDDGAIIVNQAGRARGGGVTLLSADTGMIGYPTFNQNGLSVECIYNPALVYGGRVQIISDVPKATGTWYITKLSHQLSANASTNGDWKSQIEATDYYYGL